MAGIRPLGLRAIHQVVREAKRDRYVKTEQARASAEGLLSAVGDHSPNKAGVLLNGLVSTYLYGIPRSSRANQHFCVNGQNF